MFGLSGSRNLAELKFLNLTEIRICQLFFKNIIVLMQESSSYPSFYSCHLKNAVPLMPVNAYLCPYISRCKVVRILGCTVPSDFI